MITLNKYETNNTISVAYVALPDPPLDDEMLICEGTTTVIDAMVPGGTYLWNNGSISSSIIAGSADISWVEITIGECSFVDSIQVSTHPPPSITLQADPPHCEGSMVQLIAAPATVPFSYLWHDGSTSNTYTAMASEEVWVIASLGDCVSSDTIMIEFEDCMLTVEMPNVFSPNNDGHNDRFIPIYMQGTGAITLSIFDRWGKEVHTTNNLSFGWDGKQNGLNAQEGVYYWILNYSDATGNAQAQHGSLTLLR